MQNITEAELSELLQAKARQCTDQFVVAESVFNGVRGFRALHKDTGLSMQAHDIEIEARKIHKQS